MLPVCSDVNKKRVPHLSSEGPGEYVAVADGGHDADGEEQRLGDGPLGVPAVHGAVVLVVGDGVGHEPLQDFHVLLHLGPGGRVGGQASLDRVRSGRE